MHPKTAQLQARTRRFAADVIAFCDRLPQNTACQRIAPQLIDAAGGVDSNYRAACRARSGAEFIAKLGVACEEADESKGWLELLVESNQVTRQRAEPLIQEAEELISILRNRVSLPRRGNSKGSTREAGHRRRMR